MNFVRLVQTTHSPQLFCNYNFLNFNVCTQNTEDFLYPFRSQIHLCN